MADLLEVQRELEDSLVSEGVLRFRKRLERARADRAGATEGAGKSLFGSALLRVAPAIQAWMEESRTGPKHIALRWVKAVGAEKAAYAVTRVVLDSIYTDTNAKRLALKVAEILIDELRFRKLEKEAPGLFKYKMERFNTDHYGYKKAVLSQAIRWSEVDVGEFDTTERQRLHLGSKLLDIFVSETGLVEVHSVAKKRGNKWNRGTMVRATEKTQAWLRKRNDWLEDTVPTHAPLVVPPLPWGARARVICPLCEAGDPDCPQCYGTGTWESGEHEPGGYLFSLKGTVKLVRGLPGGLRRKVEASIGPMTCAALNRLQETGWAVNSRVLAVVREALEAGGEVAGLPGMEPEPLPAKPVDIGENEEARKAWRRTAAQVHERNRSETGQRYEALKAVTLAERYVEYPAFFYVWNLDFRGRCYPVADILQPQGADVARGLLHFADSVSLGTDGAWWLALHGANCLGEHEGRKMSHLTLEDRVTLIDSCSRRIERIAADPWSDRMWQDADDPWQFLAFCFEWSDFLKAGRSGNFMSRLVVHVDGTANGLQHFSALLRDEEGAEAVNMTARQEPSDIYQRVADAVLTLLWNETGDDKPYADMWLGAPIPVDRKLVKRPTMTSAYGSGRFGFADQILHYLRNEQDVETWRSIRKHFVHEGKEVYAMASRYMAAAIWQALGQVVGSAFAAMDWLQAASREITKRGELTSWTVPVSGMLVIQPYVAYHSIQVRTVIAGQAWVPRAYQPKLDSPVAHEQANGVSPNFIHSLDAAALQMTVVRACSQGACSFAAVHDSFGSHAGNMAQVSHTLRVAFLDLHRGDILGKLREAWGIDSELPPRGTYKLDEVLSADYFFC
jgi:DNA-directed RNA polymerase